jgi:hypothetical protein
MRDEAFMARVAAVSGETRQEKKKWVTDRLAALQPRIDSASVAREKAVRDGVLADKVFLQAASKIAARNKTLNDSTVKSVKELINAKPRVAKIAADSAAMARRLVSGLETFRKKQVVVAAEVAAATAYANSLARQRDSLKTLIAEKASMHLKPLSDASDAIAQAARIVSRAQAPLDSVLLLQNSARDDSIRVDREKNVFVSQAQQVIDIKTDEIMQKYKAIDVIAAKITEVRGDSSAAMADKQEQQNVFGALLVEQLRLLHQEETAIAELELERETAEAPTRPQPVPVETALATLLKNGAIPLSPAIPPEQKQSAAEDAAQRQIMLIYDLIDKGKTEAAKDAFTSHRKLLEKNLYPEAFEAIKMTVEGVEPAPSPQPETTAETDPPPPGQEWEMPRQPATVFISSVPPVASIYMDGRLIGRTNVGYVDVLSGKHTIQFIKGDKTCTQEMSFREGQNPAVVVKLPCGK